MFSFLVTLFVNTWCEGSVFISIITTFTSSSREVRTGARYALCGFSVMKGFLSWQFVLQISGIGGSGSGTNSQRPADHTIKELR